MATSPARVEQGAWPTPRPVLLRGERRRATGSRQTARGIRSGLVGCRISASWVRREPGRRARASTGRARRIPTCTLTARVPMLQGLPPGTGRTDPPRSLRGSAGSAGGGNARLWIDARIGPSISLARNRCRRYARLNRRQARQSHPSSIGRGSSRCAALRSLTGPERRQAGGVPAVAGRQHAVEQVDPGGDRVEDVLRPADAHQVARPVGRQQVGRHRQGLRGPPRGPRRR